jgi:hypothetical protein
MVQTRPSSPAYRDGWERTFGKKKATIPMCGTGGVDECDTLEEALGLPPPTVIVDLASPDEPSAL